MPGRTYNASSSTFGFNGKLKDNEVYGSDGTSYDYGFRIYNPRIARFLSVDPLTKSYPELTPYQFASNTPIAAIDLDGLEARIVIKSQWFLSQIQTALKKNDFQEAERLTWAAVNASMPDGTPAGSFEADPNKVSGFNVYAGTTDENNVLLSTADQNIYEVPKEAWAKGQKDPTLVKQNRIENKILATKSKISRIEKRLEDLDLMAKSLQESIDNTNLSSQPDPVDPKAGLLFAKILRKWNPEIKLEYVQKVKVNLEKNKERLQKEVQKLEQEKNVVKDDKAINHTF